MSEELSNSGLYFDDLYTLRVLEPNIASSTHDLKDECINYTEKLVDFRQIANQFVSVAENYAKQVDQEKMKAIGAQNYLKTISKQRESEQQQIQAKISEKTMELDRLKLECQYLQRIESEQQEIIDNYYQNQ